MITMLDLFLPSQARRHLTHKKPTNGGNNWCATRAKGLELLNIGKIHRHHGYQVPIMGPLIRKLELMQEIIEARNNSNHFIVNFVSTNLYSEVGTSKDICPSGFGY